MKREKYLFDAGLNYYDEELKKNAAFVKKVEPIIASATDEFFFYQPGTIRKYQGKESSWPALILEF